MTCSCLILFDRERHELCRGLVTLPIAVSDPVSYFHKERQKAFLFLINLLRALPILTHLPAPYIWIEQNGTLCEASLYLANPHPAIYLKKRSDSSPKGIKEELRLCYDQLKATKENLPRPQDAKDEKTLLN
jgi:hypothetical protein